MNKPGPQREELKVFITSRESTCDECEADLGSKAWITLKKDKGTLCLSCADLDHLVFLPSGDAAVTRRAKKHSTLSAVVLKWSKARKRYERQGLLVEEPALRQAEIECLADEDARAQRRTREADRRAALDLAYVERFAGAVQRRHPRFPGETARSIAEHACTKYSGRVGRSAAAKALDEEAVRLAVVAHIRHVETEYDRLLMNGWDRLDARVSVEDAARSVLAKWSGTDQNT
ncbi:MAG: hypothetical protein A2Y76_07130 [Planctomycetes bacterium RBG_13_60_9]|nr:MAG: hypothetical protein A2Y76_07130 [Planctomycetes bacterium RBG_13_60_9]